MSKKWKKGNFYGKIKNDYRKWYHNANNCLNYVKRQADNDNVLLKFLCTHFCIIFSAIIFCYKFYDFIFDICTFLCYFYYNFNVIFNPII